VSAGPPQCLLGARKGSGRIGVEARIRFIQHGIDLLSGFIKRELIGCIVRCTGFCLIVHRWLPSSLPVRGQFSILV
jgi:hypothetical protein